MPRRLALDVAVAHLHAGQLPRARHWLQRAAGPAFPKPGDQWLLQGAKAWAACQATHTAAQREQLDALIAASSAYPDQQRFFRPQRWVERCVAARL